MFCVKCGNKIDGDEGFCPYCGSRIENDNSEIIDQFAKDYETDNIHNTPTIDTEKTVEFDGDVISENQSEQQVSAEDEIDKESKPKSNKRIIIVASCIVVSIILLVGCCMALLIKSNNKNDENVVVNNQGIESTEESKEGSQNEKAKRNSDEVFNEYISKLTPCKDLEYAGFDGRYVSLSGSGEADVYKKIPNGYINGNIFDFDENGNKQLLTFSFKNNDIIANLIDDIDDKAKTIDSKKLSEIIDAENIEDLTQISGDLNLIKNPNTDITLASCEYNGKLNFILATNYHQRAEIKGEATKDFVYVTVFSVENNKIVIKENIHYFYYGDDPIVTSQTIPGYCIDKNIKLLKLNSYDNNDTNGLTDFSKDQEPNSYVIYGSNINKNFKSLDEVQGKLFAKYGFRLSEFKHIFLGFSMPMDITTLTSAKCEYILKSWVSNGLRENYNTDDDVEIMYPDGQLKIWCSDFSKDSEKWKKAYSEKFDDKNNDNEYRLAITYIDNNNIPDVFEVNDNENFATTDAGQVAYSYKNENVESIPYLDELGEPQEIIHNIDLNYFAPQRQEEQIGFFEYIMAKDFSSERLGVSKKKAIYNDKISSGAKKVKELSQGTIASFHVSKDTTLYLRQVSTPYLTFNADKDDPSVKKITLKKGEVCKIKYVKFKYDYPEIFVEIKNNVLIYPLNVIFPIDIPFADLGYYQSLMNNNKIKISSAEDLIDITQEEYLDVVDNDVTTEYITIGTGPSGTGFIGNKELQDYTVGFNSSDINNAYGNDSDTPCLIEVTGKGVIGNDLNGNPITMGRTYKDLLTSINCLGCIEIFQRVTYCIANINGDYWYLYFEISNEMSKKVDEVEEAIGYGEETETNYDGTSYNPKLIRAVHNSDDSFKEKMSHMRTATINANINIINAPDDKKSQVIWPVKKGDTVYYYQGENDSDFTKVYYETNDVKQGIKFGYVPTEYIDFD